MATSSPKAVFTTPFQQFEATQKLRVLAQTPFDLTKEGNVTPERLKNYTSEAAGIKMVYGFQRVDEPVLQALEQLATEADVHTKMEAMQSGEVMNFYDGLPSENRAVLHTAMRDFFENPSTGKESAAAVEMARAEHKKLKAFTEKVDRDGRYNTLCLVGIGGSDLGPRALYRSLPAYYRKDRTVHFCANVDPDDSAAIISSVDLSKTLFVVVSKSGGTLETQTNEEVIRKALEKEGLDANKQVIAVTGKGSPMDNPSRYLETFYMWDYVGGRFSTTSMIGGVMAAFGLGYDNFYEVLRGASAMDKVALKRNFKENLPLLLAMLGIWNRNFLNFPTLSVVAYSQALIRFPAHLQQCDMESNGKHVDRSGRQMEVATGPVVFGEPGTSAQHSFFQLIHQGTDVVPLEFIGFQQPQFGQDTTVQDTTSQDKLVANMFAQAISLATGLEDSNTAKEFQGNRPSTLLLGKKLTPFMLGALWSLYEHKVAFQGFVWNINSFDQEGVQLGKVLANKILDSIKAKRSGTDGSSAYPLGDTLLDQLASL